MVRRKIKWSINALNDKLSILEYWYKRNGNTKYSRQLEHELHNITNLLKQYDKLGKRIHKSDRRFLVKDTFQIFYKIEEEFIITFTFGIQGKTQKIFPND
jgi:plasmid stabilization system protein ParE